MNFAAGSVGRIFSVLQRSAVSSGSTGKEEAPIADLFRLVHQPLDVPLYLPHGSLVTCCGIEPAAAIGRHSVGGSNQLEAQASREIGECLSGHRADGLVAAANHQRRFREGGDYRDAAELAAH